jgi:hypothetical protein
LCPYFYKAIIGTALPMNNQDHLNLAENTNPYLEIAGIIDQVVEVYDGTELGTPCVIQPNIKEVSVDRGPLLNFLHPSKQNVVEGYYIYVPQNQGEALAEALQERNLENPVVTLEAPEDYEDSLLRIADALSQRPAYSSIEELEDWLVHLTNSTGKKLRIIVNRMQEGISEQLEQIVNSLSARTYYIYEGSSY